MDRKKFLTIKEVSKKGEIINTLGRSANYDTIRRLIRKGKLKAIDVSGDDSKIPRFLIKREWVEEYKNKYQR